MKVSVKLDLDKVVFDKSGAVNLMASLSAPDVTKEAKRNPLCICAVIDRSGSMRESGGSTAGSKMEYVKRSMYKLIDQITDADSLSLVFFDDRLETTEFSI